MEDRFRFEAIEAEKDVDKANIAKHEVLALLNRIAAERVGVGPMLDGINLSHETHGCCAGWTVWMLVPLLPVWLPAELGSLAEVAHGVGVNDVLTLSALDESNFVFAESFHGSCGVSGDLLGNRDLVHRA